MKRLERPVSALIKSRGFSAKASPAAAAVQAQTPLPRHDPQVTRLQNGMIVASLENNSPVSRVGFFFNAGSRSEDGTNLGVTHALRATANLSAQNASGFAITKNIQQTGGNMSVSTTRDHMMYTVETVRSGIEQCVSYMTEAVSHPEFLFYEIDEKIAPKLKLDLAVMSQCPEVQLMEALHRAAYRGGMATSLYTPDYMVGGHSPDMLRQFVESRYTTGNMVMVGLGVEHDNLLAQAKKVDLPDGFQAPAKADYHGGEVRIDNMNSLVYAALVTEGASIGSTDLLPVAVLQHVMGTGPYVKYGSNVAVSKVAKAIAGAIASPFAAACINTTYTDSGLFGFQVVAQAADMTQVLEAATKTFADATKDSITEQDVQRAKSQLKSAVMMSNECGSSVYEDMGIQALAGGQVFTQAQMGAAIDAVTLQQVQSVAKKVINSKPSMAAIGDLSSTPYLDQLL